MPPQPPDKTDLFLAVLSFTLGVALVCLAAYIDSEFTYLMVAVETYWAATRWHRYWRTRDLHRRWQMARDRERTTKEERE